MRLLEAYGIWILWMLPFVPKMLRKREKAVVKDSRARWGIAIEACAYFMIWILQETVIPPWRVVGGILLGLIAAAFTASAIRHLDKEWRVDAGLNADHKLVQTGPYSVVRNPIYFGMFLMLLATSCLLTWWPVIPVAVVVFVIGTEIRVRIEEKLLRDRFGAEFDVYAARVSGYVPYLR